MHTPTAPPLVSVIIPAYNVAPFIAEALESVVGQTFADYEIVVVNDGSPDTPELERVLAPYRDRIQYIRQSNGGPSAARNTGVFHARGALISLLDADDTYLPQYLERQVHAFRADPTLALGYPNMQYFGGGPLEGRLVMDYTTQDGPVTFESLLAQQCTVLNCATIRREAILQAGGWDPAFRRSEDHDLWLRIAFGGARMIYTREPLARFRVREGSLSYDPGPMYAGQLAVYDKLARVLPLSPAQRDLLQRMKRMAAARRDLEMSKGAFARGDYAEAAGLLASANRVLRRRKLSFIRACLAVAPGALAAADRLRQRLLHDTRTRCQSHANPQDYSLRFPETMVRTEWPPWICPEHHCALHDGGLSSLECAAGHVFPVVDGIPRFVGARTYADHFGEQWKRYRQTQLDSYTGHPISRDRLRRCLGETLWHRLPDLQVLEAGCGAGRFTEVLLERGALVTSVDLSEAVDANVRNCALGPMHRVAQADLLALPFPRESYDVVLCLGVLQHTPSSERSIARLYELVKPGGWLVIDHYTYELAWYTKTAPLFRMVLKRLPSATSMRITERLVNLALPLHKRVARSRLRSIVFRLSPVLTHYVTYPELPDDIQRQWALLDTHDSLTDWFKHFRTAGQIRRHLERLGLQDIWCEYGGNGVEARGRRPAGCAQVRDASSAA
jgi:glycosyltransferase involved in cell wall biosynthesis/2-polyprenyl-3-methyl-5-hydroxy-6-metoxy-1,4-benzoquinol methylase